MALSPMHKIGIGFAVLLGALVLADVYTTAQKEAGPTLTAAPEPYVQ